MAENLDEPKYESCCKEIRRLFTDCKVSPEHAVLHAPFNELHPAAIDPLAKDLARHRMEQAYTACKDLGITKMVVHSGYVPHIYFKSWHQEQSVKFWTGFMADKPADFQLCIENVLEDEPQMMADMLKDIDQPNIGICLDIGPRQLYERCSGQPVDPGAVTVYQTLPPSQQRRKLRLARTV